MAKKAESGGYARLKGDLAQKTPGSFYVLYGEEDYLRRYYLSMLRRQLVDGPTEDFNFHRLTSENFSMQVLSESLEALPMMAERTMIQVDDVDLFALPEDDRTQLAALFSDIPDYACLVLVYADFKPDKRKKKLWDAMEKNAVLAEFAYQTERDLTAWIVRHFRAEKKNISPALCGYLLQRCGSSMTRPRSRRSAPIPGRTTSSARTSTPLWSRRSRRLSLRSPTRWASGNLTAHSSA